MTTGSGQPTFSQHNKASKGGQLNANQGSGNMTVNNQNQTINNGLVPRRGPRTDTKILLGLLVLDVAFFFYGSAAYTGMVDKTADEWRAGIFLFLLVVTIRMIRRWFTRR